ncbi:exodeoxyribonuclease VII small subunit [Acuticoccus sp. M5D2P5]|uniref:exodeoxyribonuclease VII small subunit n=1 Tax=Acuticoccus kalidii TaxID=2910977 RepID=UPI001F218C27|nr:exodeoxyribonuclease VII small subunit [Acuticoccus kalidii]MCF3934217.1 exodeoxyribonuclease VII small subunit [Acuticoccus kalidii]
MPEAPALAEAKPVEELSFEAAMGELEAIVDKLEKGNVPLEESIAYYERGEALKTRCDTLLKNAEMRVEKVRLKTDGTATGVEPLDGESDIPF